MNDNDNDDSDDGDKNYLATKVFARRGTVGVRLMSLLHVARAACRPPLAGRLLLGYLLEFVCAIYC